MQEILIIANSGRLMAQFAKNAGYSPLVIDCFADSDTQELADECIKVETLALKNILAPLAKLIEKQPALKVIYGSGFEYYNESLEYLHQNLNVLGNPLDVFLNIQNKDYFFSTLERLKIPFPETRFIPPLDANGWLIKPLQGEGGLGIKKYQSDIAKNCSGAYWQKQIVGDAMSVLFVTNGVEVKSIGFHQQYVTGINDNSFVFSTIVSQPEIDMEIEQIVISWLHKMVVEFKLQGLNSLDFMIDNGQCYVLEVNARPSASMQLYKDDLFSAHIKCQLSGGLNLKKAMNDYQVYHIVYAETDLIITKPICWPEWVVDIPESGGLIHTNMPICSIIAGGKTKQQVLDLLQARQQQLTKLLYR